MESKERTVKQISAYGTGALLLKEESVIDIPEGIESEYEWNK